MHKIGASVDRVEGETEYAYRALIRYDGDLKALADYMENIPGCEVLSLRPFTRDRQGSGRRRRGRQPLQASQASRAPMPSDMSAWPPSPTSTFPERIRTGPTPFPMSRWFITVNSPTTSTGSGRLERSGHRFQSECDSEIIAVYLAEKMAEGHGLEDAMHKSLEDLDGVFTYMVVTGDALGVAKDAMAAKPLVLYESDGLVAMASEEVAIRAIIDREIETSDPYEGEVLVWTR